MPARVRGVALLQDARLDLTIILSLEDNAAMKRKPTSCRSCGGTDFFTKTVAASGGFGPNLLPLGLLASSKFTLVVCGACGLTDWYVGRMDLVRVRDRFKKLN